MHFVEAKELLPSKTDEPLAGGPDVADLQQTSIHVQNPIFKVNRLLASCGQSFVNRRDEGCTVMCKVSSAVASMVRPILRMKQSVLVNSARNSRSCVQYHNSFFRDKRTR